MIRQPTMWFDGISKISVASFCKLQKIFFVKRNFQVSTINNHEKLGKLYFAFLRNEWIKLKLHCGTCDCMSNLINLPHGIDNEQNCCYNYNIISRPQLRVLKQLLVKLIACNSDLSFHWTCNCRSLNAWLKYSFKRSTSIDRRLSSELILLTFERGIWKN